MGFGWNFYGFFLFCVIWIAGYFLWARGQRPASAQKSELPSTTDRHPLD